MRLFYRLAADAVVIIHAAYVAFVVVGLLLIIVGGLRRWQWVRNVWFRMLHLAAIGLVVVEAWVGIVCPLTTLEKWLRGRAGQTGYRGDFIANFVHEVLFVDWPPWVFTTVYTLFGLAVLATLVLIPPRRRSCRLA